MKKEKEEMLIILKVDKAKALMWIEASKKKNISLSKLVELKLKIE